MATIDEIKQKAAAVKNATQVGENTALRVGGVLVDICEWMKNLSGTSGGSGASLGTLLTKLNSDNPFPTGNGQVLTYNGSNFIWKIPTGSGVVLNPTMSAMNEHLGKTSWGTPQFLYWSGSEYTWKNESEISGGSGSIQVAKEAEQGYSEQWYDATKLRFVGIGGTQITVSPNSIKNCVDVGIPTGGGSGSSGTTAGKLRFYQDGSEEAWNGEYDFKINFGSGINVDWDTNHKYITLSATGGSSTGGSVDLSSYLTKTEASRTYAAKSHNHSINDIISFTENVKATKVNNATNADKATQLANSRTIWGQSFNGTSNINGHLYMSTAGGDSIQLWMNNGNMLERTNNTLHIGYGLKASSDGEINLDAYATKVYTDNYSKHYDFKRNVFDVNSNQIHFGSETNGGKISWDAANNAFKIEGNVYATGGITALGVSNNATTSNNVDFTFRSVTVTGNKQNKVQLTDEGLIFVNQDIIYAYYKKDSIGLYDSANDMCCDIFSFTDNMLTFDPNGYDYDIIFNPGISCNTLENTLKVGYATPGYIKFHQDSTMTFEYNNKNYSFNVAKAIEQGILTI